MDTDPQPPPEKPGEVTVFIVRRESKCAACGEPLRLAVIAHIRHAHTRYDEFLMSHGNRPLARVQVAAEIDHVMRGWET